MEDWKEYLSFIAEALGKKDAAQKILNHYDQRIKELKIALNNQYKDKKISVVSVSDFYGIDVETKNSFSGYILADLGLKRPELQDIIIPGGRINAVSEEKLELIDGDILFVQAFNNHDKEMLKKLIQKPLWKKLKVVQKGQIYSVDGWT